MEEELNLRMYFFVPYNISEIQKGIQSGHAALRYARKYSDENPMVWDFVDNHETWIILNGGTTNSNIDINGTYKGSLNQILDNITDNKIKCSHFREPELNNALTSICFIADERVWNNEFFINWDKFLESAAEQKMDDDFDIDEVRSDWVKLVGGKQNVFLKELLSDKKLA